MLNNTLIICVGNICHSPTTKRLLQRYHPKLKVESAGLDALVNKGADPITINVTVRHQLPLEGHRARRVNHCLYRSYDLILTMKKRHIEHLCETTSKMRGRVMLLGRWGNEYETPDPYRKNRETFTTVYALPERSIRQRVQALSAEQV